jgi:LPS-assembly protein
VSRPRRKKIKTLRRTILPIVSLVGGMAASFAVHAQQTSTPSQEELDNALREAMKLDRVLPTPGTIMQRKKEGPIVLEADRMEGVAGKRATASGSVVLQQDNVTINSDRLTYDQATATATAPGVVKLFRDRDLITGKALVFNVTTETGTLDDPTFLFARSPARPTQKFEARGGATKMNMEGPDKERLFDAFYTTCKVNENEWYLRVKELALDRTTNVGTAYNGYVEFKGVPILYLPYASFPLDNERKSGFLPPSFGSSSKSGLEFAQPYYWNIAPDRDATITPKIFLRRGLQLGGEFRYLTPRSLGQIEAEYLPNDRLAKADRYFVSTRHFQQLDELFGQMFRGKLGNGWTGALNLQKASDDAYFRDLSTRIAATSQTNLPRDAALTYSSDYGNLTTRLLSFQTLQDPTIVLPTPYKLAPQVTFNATPARTSGFEFNTVGEYTDFRHPTLVNGQRWLLYPSVSLPITRPYGFLTPKIGYHMTRYDLTKNEGNFESGTRTLPIASLDSGLTFERPFTWRNNAMTQTLEPRVFFLYVPFRDQSKLPVFSTFEADFNFAQVFNENLFIGGDRISDAQQITTAVTSRFIENATGIERLRAAIGQRYYARPQRVALGSERPTDALGLTGQATGSRSDILAAVSGQVSERWFLDSSFQFSTSQGSVRKSNIAARFVDGGRLVNLSYRFTQDSLKQVDISTQWPLGKTAPGWTILARANHSFRDRKLLEGLFGVEYNQGCWEFRMVAHRFTTATQQYSNSIQFQLELKGLSKLGINPLETIRQNIPGYRSSTASPN